MFVRAQENRHELGRSKWGLTIVVRVRALRLRKPGRLIASDKRRLAAVAAISRVGLAQMLGRRLMPNARNARALIPKTRQSVQKERLRDR